MELPLRGSRIGKHVRCAMREWPASAAIGRRSHLFRARGLLRRSRTMLPNHIERVERIRESIDELETAGIHVMLADDAALRGLVREHLDFLQSMLGYDASMHSIMQLIESHRALTRTH
jgi:DNA-binding transcriptional regulator PaaX